MKQTAVEWLVEVLEDNSINLDLAYEIIEQAKEMENKHLKQAFKDSRCDIATWMRSIIERNCLISSICSKQVASNTAFLLRS